MVTVTVTPGTLSLTSPTLLNTGSRSVPLRHETDALGALGVRMGLWIVVIAIVVVDTVAAGTAIRVHPRRTYLQPRPTPVPESTYSNTSEAPAAHIPTDAPHKPNHEEKSPTSSQYARVGALVTTRKFVGTTPRISR
jgi:hypothetical protein